MTDRQGFSLAMMIVVLFAVLLRVAFVFGVITLNECVLATVIFCVAGFAGAWHRRSW